MTDRDEIERARGNRRRGAGEAADERAAPRVDDLSVVFHGDDGRRTQAVDGVGFSVARAARRSASSANPAAARA